MSENSTYPPYRLVSRAANAAYRDSDQTRIVRISDVEIGGTKPVVIAGPCAVESREQTLEIARAVQAVGADMLRGGAYKPRTSPYDFQGLGEKGLEILAEARAELSSADGGGTIRQAGASEAGDGGYADGMALCGGVYRQRGESGYCPVRAGGADGSERPIRPLHAGPERDHACQTAHLPSDYRGSEPQHRRPGDGAFRGQGRDFLRRARADHRGHRRAHRSLYDPV